ncbi:OpgC domain-containing protein [Candidatus Saccharibacteria bacterium]|nr:OpgC domain-containing protein [Candidatus Saccharibacteria bacterium]
MSAIERDLVITSKVPKSKRILAFDLMRGFFLLVIMIDHVELYPNLFDLFTGKGRLWASAAEGFFFLSGLLIGMVYRRRLALGMRYIFKKMWSRAAQLYVVGVSLTLLFLCWVEFTHHAPIKDTLPSPLPWHHIIEQSLLMRFTYGWADFLVRFSILMLIAPFVFYLVAKGKWWLAAIGITAAWVFRGQGFTLAWQLIFNYGIIIGFYWQQIEDWFRALPRPQRSVIRRSVAVAALITFAISYASVFVLSLLFHLWGADRLPASLQHVAYTWGNWNYDTWLYADKWTMGPVRVVLFFLWFTLLYWLVRRYESQISRFSRGLLELLGQNSLFVYTVHAFIVFIFKMYFIPIKTNFFQNVLITGAGLCLLVGITVLYKNLRPRLPKIKLGAGKRSERSVAPS